MLNDAAAEKAGSAEHGDGATVRCHHDSNRQFMSELLTACGRGTIQALEQAINFARHLEVVLMKSFDLLGAQLLFLAGAPASTAATPSGLMLKAKNINGSLPGFPHWCTKPYGS